MVAASMPPKTVVPIDWRLAAPAPVATIRESPQNECECGHQDGTQTKSPRFHRRFDDPFAFSRSLRANSTIRMAFLAERPISMTKPIWE